jgi:hypothetical protein
MCPFLQALFVGQKARIMAFFSFTLSTADSILTFGDTLS